MRGEISGVTEWREMLERGGDVFVQCGGNIFG